MRVALCDERLTGGNVMRNDAAFEQLLQSLKGLRQLGPGQWIAVCPAHSGGDGSLHVGRTSGGLPILECVAGCGSAQIVAAALRSERVVESPRTGGGGTVARSSPCRDSTAAIATDTRGPVPALRPSVESLQLLKPKEAALVLAVSPRKLWDLTARGEIATVRFGRCVRYRVDDVRQWIAQNKRGSR
ncbi:helix-turn-helix domain-containing protein [Pirellulales bacterium]|nr:helix-turn-helix domain-containing protein [Pirellulales bacterium]